MGDKSGAMIPAFKELQVPQGQRGLCIYIFTSRTECSQVPLYPNLEVKDFGEP